MTTMLLEVTLREVAAPFWLAAAWAPMPFDDEPVIVDVLPVTVDVGEEEVELEVVTFVHFVEFVDRYWSKVG